MDRHTRRQASAASHIPRDGPCAWLNRPQGRRELDEIDQDIIAKERGLNVSAVICAKNAEGTIGMCLESVRRNAPSEIIVIDDGSTDRTPDIARRLADAVYLNEGGTGLAYARQLGVDRASGSRVFFVDSDIILPDGCLSKMMAEMEERGYTGINAQILGFTTTNYWEWAEDQHFRTMFNREGERSYISTMASVYVRDAVVEHRFDPFFKGAAEDLDLCYRLRSNAHKLGMSSAHAFHMHRATFGSLFRQKMWHGRGRARYVWKHRSIVHLLGASLMIPVGIAACVRNRSPKMLPYYLVWSLAGNVGLVRELAALILRRLVPDIP
jgi:glycosyltransferase involved in cell wall biosynthesis